MLANGVDPYDHYYGCGGSYLGPVGASGEGRGNRMCVGDGNTYPGQYNEAAQNSPESAKSQDFDDDLTDHGRQTPNKCSTYEIVSSSYLNYPLIFMDNVNRLYTRNKVLYYSHTSVTRSFLAPILNDSYCVSDCNSHIGLGARHFRNRILTAWKFFPLEGLIQSRYC